MNWQDYENRMSAREVKHSVIKELTINIASADVIKNEWSYGEVKKPETINYRTLRPEKGGLFCEKIFGPVKDWECACGKYSKIKHRGIVCDRCGVEVTLSKVRRERMAHIDLAVPIVHLGFLRSSPSKIGSLLGLSMSEIEKVTYYEQYIVTDPKATDLEKKQLLSISYYRELVDKLGRDSFVAKMGGEAIRDLLISEDLKALEELLKTKTRKARSMQLRVKLAKRLKVVETFLKSGNKPESMVLTAIPVIPPDLRPLLALDGGRFATSDLNDLQKRMLHRNCRLKTIARMKTPEVIYRSEMRLLQEAVDAYYDNGRRASPIVGSGGRPLKSLSESLRGKQGRFRQNLLGKRVDFSARSVIVAGPELKLNQCGLPKAMALQLFEPFIIRKLQSTDSVYTVKAAKKMIQGQSKEVWDVLDEVTKNHPVVLNRAPTLHRLGLQGFYPVLVEGKAIQLHPLVCSSYNADFDGDQMAVYIPLSIEAQAEVSLLMMAADNMFLPSSGKPTSVPTKDMTLGIYYLTAGPFYDPEEHGRRCRIFSSAQEVVCALEASNYDDWELPWENDYPTADGGVDNLGRGMFIHEKIKVRINGVIVETTPGRVLFNNVMPKVLGFFNKPISQKTLEEIVVSCHKKLGLEVTAVLLDDLKCLGFKEATTFAMSLGMKDLVGFSGKDDILNQAERSVDNLENQHEAGIITAGERETQEIGIWTEANNKISANVFKVLSQVYKGKQNPLFTMLDSGARGNQGQMKQLCGMRGLMARPSGAIISFAIKSNFREGMTPLEFFIATHGGRKGLADTALRTADSGFLMRRLVDVAQSNVIRVEDCCTLDGCRISKIGHGQHGELLPLKKRIVGRVLADMVVADKGVVLANVGDLVTAELADAIWEAGIKEVVIRSVMTCSSANGICQKCYGVDLSNGSLVCVGTPVGIIAAQSIGEPGTQLTMRTFHTGGIASASLESNVFSNTSGIVLFDNISCVGPVTIEDNNQIYVSVSPEGFIHIVRDFDPSMSLEIVLENIKSGVIKVSQTIAIDMGVRLFVAHGDIISDNTKLIEIDIHSVPIVCTSAGIVKFQDIIEGISVEKMFSKTGGDSFVIKQKRENIYPQIMVVNEDGIDSVSNTYYLPDGAVLSVEEGVSVTPGTLLARVPRSALKTIDITGGLSRVVELFEARKPKDAAAIAKISGVVSFGSIKKGKRSLLIQDLDTGMGVETLVPIGSHIIVQNGTKVFAGQPLTSGMVSTSELLEVCGVDVARRFLLDQVQTIYRLQGVDIDDKHIEMIIKSMMQKVRIVSPGDVASFLYGEDVSMQDFITANDLVIAEGGRPAKATPLLLGITQAALSTDSPISRASFQSASSVVYNAAFAGSVEKFVGCKENVIVANLIPAGTGFRGKEQKAVLQDISPAFFEDNDYWDKLSQQLLENVKSGLQSYN